MLRLGCYAPSSFWRKLKAMAELTRIVELLQQQRRTLLEQLEAVDRAIAALDGAGTPEAPSGDEPRAEGTPGDVVATQIKARRTQTDSHRHAVALGKRKARHARDAAKGLVREVHDDSFVPAIKARGDREAPRLVKRPVKK
jgi:hypothetical protein